MSHVQLTIFLDDAGTIHAEAPGTNGSRKKIDLYGSGDDWKSIILAELHLQLTELRAKARADLQTQQLENIKYVVENHNEKLAKRVWPSELVFNRSLQRQLQDTNLASRTGLTVPEHRDPVPRTKKPTPTTTCLKIPA